MSKKISQNQIQQLRDKYSSDNHVKVVRNAMIKTNSNELSMDWEKYRKIDHSFSHVIWTVFFISLDQKLIRENPTTVEENFDSRIVMHLLQTPTEDGGQWDMWKNLINKYGVIPQAEMSESFSSSQSAEMNKMLARKLRENAHDLRKEFSKGASNEELNKLKNSMIEEIFKMLSMHLGTPPKSFNWQVRDKDKKFSRYENLTPQSFYEDHVGLNLDDYVCLINCPMSNKEYNKVYTVEHLGNVIEGSPIRYLNVESDVMKDASIKSIKDDHPVWFGCDVGKHFHRDLGVMDTDLFDYEMFYNTDFKMNKAERLEYGQSQMTHAMLFTGVDLDDNGKSIKWRVENSWGDKGGNKGYHIMSDDWFDEYNYEVVVHKDYLSDELNDIFQNAEAIPLKPWDPMGALAK